MVTKVVEVDQIPQDHRPVAAAGGQGAAIRGERHREHRAGVAGQGAGIAGGDERVDQAGLSTGVGVDVVRGDAQQQCGAGVADTRRFGLCN